MTDDEAKNELLKKLAPVIPSEMAFDVGVVAEEVGAWFCRDGKIGDSIYDQLIAHYGRSPDGIIHITEGTFTLYDPVLEIVERTAPEPSREQALFSPRRFTGGLTEWKRD